MNISEENAWCFHHPDFDIHAQKKGLGFSPSGGIAMVSGAAAVRQSVLLLLSTLPGERVRRPGYGCDLHKLVFMPNDATTHGLAIHYIRQALRRWEPRVRIVKLDADASPADPARMEITLDYEVVGSLGRDVLVMSYNLSEPER